MSAARRVLTGPPVVLDCGLVRISIPLVAALVTCAASTAATAASTLAAPHIAGGANVAAACYLRNVGAKPVTVTVALVDGNGAAIETNFDGCNAAPLGGGQTCALLVNALSTTSFACTVTTNGSAKNLRGSMELRDVVHALRVIHAEDLR